ncbi:MAG: hypothetical protein AUH43_08585 [Acidobacteria bacterium 13_1_40CM_65_14]|nr:MAG: hypothetical protein AUH43_08585 [Acidobacteria bacterium 13_1_40CM_65_14]
MRPSRFLALVLALFAAFGAQSIVGRSEQTPASSPAAASAGGPFDTLRFRPIGPAGMSGRISDLAVYEPNPAIFYVGTAHGGVWKTVNAGTTFEPQFQDNGLIAIGDVTVSQSNPELVWVGSGESNNRQSTSWGDGVYKSTNGGKTYTNVGLKSSRHINRIVIDPRNNDTVFVAATGPLFGPGGERGVFKTTDGGKNWKQVLKVDDDTGANDLVMDGTNNQILYASTYQRRRTACCMNGGGPGSGIWKSTDGGETWTRLTGGGLPDGPLGRIGLDVYRKRPNILYAVIEGAVPPGGRGGRGAAGNPDEAPAVQPGRSTNATGVTNIPTGLYRSDDAGATWRKVNDENPRPMYFSQVRIDPNDPDVVIYGGVGLHFSNDAGKNVHVDIAVSTHDDVHAIWIDPSNSNHVLIGNDGGLAVSHDQAKTWVFFPNLPVGLFYHVSVDMATPYNVCGGMQDNYSWCGPSQVRGSAGIANYEWKTVQGGDGFVAIQDPTDYRIAYSESQDGNMVRLDRVTGESMPIRPLANPGDPAIRWNWDTPLYMSPHNPSIIYGAGNRVFRSSNRGLNWEALGADLTSNANRDDIVTMGVKGSEITVARNDGIQTWPTIVSFAESPKRANILYAGTDDGHLQVSREGGRTWTDVIDKVPGIPKGSWVSEVQPSRFDEARVYATFDNHRLNDFETYVYASDDYGQSWRSIAGNLKGEVVKTITEDTKNPDVLYLGAETGLFVSLDRGRRWTRIKANLPTVRIDEITIHPRDNAMVLATHGRAIWILDHLEPIQEYAAAQATTTPEIVAKLFSPPPYAMFRRPARDRNYEFWGDQTFYGENPPQAAMLSWLNKKQVGDVKLKITDAAGREVREISGPVLANSNKPGIQTACWDLRVQPAPAPPPAAGRGQTGGQTPGQTAGQTGGQTASQTGGQTPGQTAGQTVGQTPDPQAAYGAGCGTPGGGGGGGGFGGGGATVSGPFVLAGVYNVALIVDGKTVDTKPLRVNDDPEVILTSIERKRQYDMAMEIHALQPRISDASAAHASLTRQINELSTSVASRGDVPADVKASVDSLKSELASLAPKLTQPQGRGFGGGGGRGANDSLITKVGQAKNGLMGGMTIGEQTTRAYTEVKSQTPKAIADLNATIAKATTLSTTLARYNLTLTVPSPVAAPPVAPARKTSSGQR